MIVKFPNLRFPGFEGKWEVNKLGGVSKKINSGKTPLGGEAVYTDKGVTFIRSQNVNHNRLELLNSVYISEKINNGMLNSIVKPNDILLNITGASLGRSCVVPNDFEIGNVNQHVCIIRVNEEYNPRFIQPILSSSKGQNIFLSLQTGSGREGLNFESIKGIQISFPPLSEQDKIANFISLLGDRISTQKKIINNLESLMQGFREKIFSQKLRFKDENGNYFPQWQKTKLGDIGTFQTSSIDKLLKSDEKEVYLVNYMNVYRHEIINSTTIKSFQIVTAKENQINGCSLKKGDILFTPSSETPKDIGHSVVISENLENAVFSYHLMRFRPIIDIDILYSHYFCNISSILNQLTKLATGSTRFTISLKSFSNIEINLPSLQEQTIIANFLSSIENKIDIEKKLLIKFEAQKKYLLNNLFI